MTVKTMKMRDKKTARKKVYNNFSLYGTFFVFSHNKLLLQIATMMNIPVDLESVFQIRFFVMT